MTELIDINQLARMTGLSVSSLYKLSAKRLLPVIKIGRRLLFRLADIEQWIESYAFNPMVAEATDTDRSFQARISGLEYER